jgi:hypothetical protein
MGSDDRANYKNDQKDPDGNVLNHYYTLCLNGKKANVADSEVSSENESCRITITLNESLQEGDSIYVTAYRNKNADGKDASIYFLYENGTEVSDSKVYANICSETADVDYDGDGAEPTTHGYLIPAEAGGDLLLVNGNMLPLSMAGAYATHSTSTAEKSDNNNAPSYDGRNNTTPSVDGRKDVKYGTILELDKNCG